jgi:hypothetical protein
MASRMFMCWVFPTVTHNLFLVVEIILRPIATLCLAAEVTDCEKLN